ncbi:MULTISPECIES: LPS-assembly protein LptD [unclassified Nitrospina]|uniref:LPS-assembly protein LptD n=1 Tax=unclassified Nitrospina TaxID=2638683 RepID=UPI003F9B8E55
MALLAGLLGFVPSPALSQSVSPVTSPEQKEDPVEITADYMEHLVKENLIKARGNVVVRYQNRSIRADKMAINTESGQGHAQGNVVMKAEDGSTVEAVRGDFNIKTHRGILLRSRGTLKGQQGQEYYVTGKVLRRFSEEHYQTEDATLTTCTGVLPDWMIEVGKADILMQDRALFTGGVFRVKGIPFIYIPVGYVPIITERKSGFLMPSIGTSNLDGLTIQNRYFWAINRSYDATLGADYMENRGLRSSLEFRYRPSETTEGWWRGEHLKDDISGKTFWKLDARHQQVLPGDARLLARLDQTSGANFNKTFKSQTEIRTRRSSDSFLSIFKGWETNSLDILGRYRESEQAERDDTFGILPSITWVTQSFQLGNSGFYFNQESSATQFLLDLDPTIGVDNEETLQRFDFHPQLSYPITFAPWLRLTPQVGFRETYYNKELSDDIDPSTNQPFIRPEFTREVFEFSAFLEGPKFNRVFKPTEPGGPAYKHVIEPRVQYDYISGFDRKDREKIRIIDGVDDIRPTEALTYFLTQRLLRKDTDSKGNSEVRQVARFEISQSYNIKEARRFQTPLTPRRPFSDLRFDLDTRFTDYFMFNFDSEYNVYDGFVQRFNFDVGIRLSEWLMVVLEKRQVHNESAMILGTLDVTLPKGLNFKYSARFDEFNDRVLEHNGRASYSDPCKCWGLSFDFIRRRNINLNVNQAETKMLLSFELRGLADFDGSRGETFIHRGF